MITFCCSDKSVIPSQRVKIGGMRPVVLKSKFGQVLGWAAWAILLTSTLMIGATEGLWPMAQTALAGAALGFAMHLLLVRPRITVSDEGVRVVNPLSNYSASWEAIERIDTKWGLALYVANRKIQAWSAPAPGRHSSLRSSKFEGRHLPESSYLAGTIRPGDLVSSDSGAAAYAIRSEWERRRDLGMLVGEPTHSKNFDWRLLAMLGLLLALAVLANLN